MVEVVEGQGIMIILFMIFLRCKGNSAVDLQASIFVGGALNSMRDFANINNIIPSASLQIFLNITQNSLKNHEKILFGLKRLFILFT